MAETFKFVWATDIHLDFLRDEQVEAWFKGHVASRNPAAVLVTGDISNAPSLENHLKMIRRNLSCDLYFVLGNHDYWEGSVSSVRNLVRDEKLKQNGMHWMGSHDFVPFGKTIALIGHDGWYDGILGDVSKSNFVMRDWFKIEEFAGKLELSHILTTSRQLASGAAAHVVSGCKKAIEAGRTNLVVMTHFPPFEKACLYQGRRSDPGALPWYSSDTMGKALEKLADENPQVSFTIFCGHTHSYVDVKIRPNLRVIVGGSEYGSPQTMDVGVKDE